MAIERNHRFEMQFEEAFPQGLVMVGEVSADNEYQSREDRAAGRPTRQRVDEVTGKRQWKFMATDLGEPKAKRASFEMTLLADVQPVPTTGEVLPGMRPVELEGLTAEPRVGGQGEFKYQTYVFRATGFRAAASGSGSGSGSSGAAKSSRSAASSNSDESKAA
ncbi:hypothetical protein [Amycolatopsis rubida]|uniref:Plasmid replication, integration and excision activator n=1 Tax=Amycolatopsis rubida TaxID=112413 RepID=A0A1I6A464_9PSEU|nr:hypothetical protein [Amycolatopsis rubida]SFQ63514.1 hypothetical protein SAMN05421854_11791 [Amycolatopsis rubida]